MAERFIEEVYQYSYLISRLREVVERYRYQEDYHALRMVKGLIPGLEQALSECVEQEYEEAEYLQALLYSLSSLTEGIALADVLEKSVIPVMERWMQSWISVDEQMDNRYKIESTSSGFLTVKDTQSGCYLHSNNDPMDEARKSVECQFDYSKKAYMVWGCGLGYHLYQIYRISEGTIPIVVYESNLNLIQYALRYGVLSWIPKENLDIVSGYTVEEFFQRAQETDGIFILRSAIDAVQNDSQRHLLQQYHQNLSTGKSHYILDIPGITAPIAYYQYAYTISLMRQVVGYCRCMDERHAGELLGIVENRVEEFIRACLDDKFSEAAELRDIFAKIYDLKDMILLGDILESAAIPLMENWMKCSAKPDEMLDATYRLETTETGFLTLKDVSHNIFLHSKNDPMDEARKVLERQYNEESRGYSVWGSGLGYHIYQIYVFSKGTIPIRLYETNAKMVEYAYRYGVLSWIPEGMLEITYVKDAEDFFSRAEGDIFFLNSYVQTCEKEDRNKLMKVYARALFGFESVHNLKLNYYQNMQLGLPYVSKIDHRKLKKEMVVLGGGPSLDHFMDVLKSWQGKKTIIAAGTVWKKLLRAGIHPDFVVIMDPYDMVYQQVENIEDTSATLLLAQQAYWKVGRSYKGKKYIIPHYLYIDELDQKTEKDGETLYFSGGSVTVFELEFAIRMFPDKVYLLGVDLSLPGGMTHAEGTTYRQKVDVSDLIPVEDVNGNTVYTDHALIESISYFETIMAETEGIEYINMSDVGAKLKGTKPYRGKTDKA